MTEQQTEKRMYYNVPALTGKKSPVTVAGVVLTRNDEGQVYARLVIHKDPGVRVECFTLLYRCSGVSVRMRDPANPFVNVTYDREDLNEKEYIVLRLPLQNGGLIDGFTALISTVTLENGQRVTYRATDYRDPQIPCAGADLNRADPLLRAYYERSNPQSKVKAHRRTKKGSGKLSEYVVGIATGVLLVGIIGFAIFKGLTAILNSEESALDKRVAAMLEERRYSQAYHLVEQLKDDEELSASATEMLQTICEKAAADYQAVHNFEKAHLYALAAPFPFDEEVMESFLEHFIEEGRAAEAYLFLQQQEGYANTCDRACVATVLECLEKGAYDDAVRYTEEAPLSARNALFEKAVEAMTKNGEISDESWAVLVRMNGGKDSDDFVLSTASSMKDPFGIIAVLERLQDEGMRNRKIQEACVNGMKAYTDAHRLAEATRLYEMAGEHLDAVQKNDCLDRLAGYCYLMNDTAGNIYFRHLLGEDISQIAVEAGDISIRDNGAVVYSLLSEAQKRSYHAVTFDLYKEVFRIKNGILEGTELTDVVSVSSFEDHTVVLHQNGSISAVANEGHNKVLELPEVEGMVQIAVGADHVVMLHHDGSVSVAGDNSFGQGEVSQWTQVIKIAAGENFSLGLCADGRVVACGSNQSGQCDVAEYENVIDIAACDQSTVLLFADGSVKVVGDVSAGLKKADDFTDVEKIRAGANTIVAQRKNGSFVMASGVINGDSGSVGIWTGVKEFAAGSVCVGYVDATGTIHIDGDGKPGTGSQTIE